MKPIELWPVESSTRTLVVSAFEMLDARVVVAEDLPVVAAVLGEAVRAVLAHADAVAEAAPLDHPVGRLRLGRHGERRDGGGESEAV